MLILLGAVLEGSIVLIDGWIAHDELVLNLYDHCRIFRSDNEFAIGKKAKIFVKQMFRPLYKRWADTFFLIQ